MASCWRIDKGLTLKLKDPSGDPRWILRHVCSVSHAEQNGIRIDQKWPTEVRLQLWRQSTLQIIVRWPFEDLVRQVSCSLHRLVSVVRGEGVRWASRSSSQSSQAFPAVVSGSLFIVGVIFEVLVEKLSRQIRRQPLSASFCELGWRMFTTKHWELSFK